MTVTKLRDTARENQIETNPVAVLKDAHAKLKQAEMLRQNRQFNRAEKICLSLLQNFPDYFGALHTIGLVYADKQQHKKAVDYLNQAAMINPRSWTTLTALAGEYLLLRAEEMAITTLRRALTVNESNPAVWVTLSQIYYEQREYVLAAEADRKALELEPGMTEALPSLARSLMALGQNREAAEVLERQLAKSAPTLNTLGLIAQLPGPLIQRDLIADLGTLVIPPGVDKREEKTRIAFVRAIALDKTDRHREAWDMAVKANALALGGRKGDMLKQLKLNEDRAGWIGENIAKFKQFKNTDADYPASLFILGLSRSGKTTTESILASQPTIYRGYENPAISTAITHAYQSGGLITFKSIAQLPYQLYPTMRETYKEIVRNLMDGKSVFTNTAPGHIWDAPLVYKALPNTKFVFIKRDFHDVALRIFMKNYQRGNLYSYDLHALKRYARAYNTMIDLMCEAFPDNTILINYEDMVRDPAGALDSMCQLIGIKADHGLLPEVTSDVGCSEPYRDLMDAALAENPGG